MFMLTLTSTICMSPVCQTLAVLYTSLKIFRKSTYGLLDVDISSIGRLISALRSNNTPCRQNQSLA